MAEAQGQCPFSDEDFRQILQLERSSSAEDGWSLVSEDVGSTVWKKVSSDSNIHLVKAFLDFKGIPAERMVTLLHDLDVRKRYDELFYVYETLEDLGSYRVTYAVFKFPPGIWDRDLVQYNTKRSTDEEHIILYKNAEHPDRPVDSSRVRAETIFSGSIVRPMVDDPESCVLTLFLQTDIKGWIPSSVMNLLARSGPKRWQKSVMDFYHGTYKKEVESQL